MSSRPRAEAIKTCPTAKPTVSPPGPPAMRGWGPTWGGVAARMARGRLFGADGRVTNAAALTQALGGLKGPMMKVAQMMATIPDLLPPEYAEELQTLQSDAPPMGAAFVKRRMQAELGHGLAAESSGRSTSPRRRRLARPGPQGDDGRARRSPASCNIPTCSRRWRPTSTSSTWLFGLHRQFSGGDRHARHRPRTRRSPARGAGLRARGEERRALRRHPRRRRDRVRVPHGASRSSRPGGC